MWVTLAWSEVLQGGLVGVNRRIRRLRQGSQHRWGYDGADNWSAHCEGALAEMAVAKATGRYWADSTAPDYEGDIGVGIQVRHTTRVDGRLIVHEEDDDDHLFVLVRGEAPRFDVAGWLPGADAKQPAYWTDPKTGRPAYFVAADKLRSIEELP